MHKQFLIDTAQITSREEKHIALLKLFSQVITFELWLDCGTQIRKVGFKKSCFEKKNNNLKYHTFDIT